MSLKSSLQIKAGYKSGKTFLQDSYCTHPFKAADITEDKTGNLLRLMIMSSSPGILDNDNYNVRVDVEEHAKLWLTTQGYQRIFKMKNSASQEVNINVGNNASFVYLPHPTVPHEDADFISINNISLQKNHQFIWSEIITCGRKHSGESFKFKRYSNKATIFIEEKLVVFENVSLLPAKNNLHSIGQLEGYTHQSSLIFLNNLANMKLIAEELNALINEQPGVSFGISALAVNGLVIRMLGHKGEQLFKLQNDIAELITLQSESCIATTSVAYIP